MCGMRVCRKDCVKYLFDQVDFWGYLWYTEHIKATRGTDHGMDHTRKSD